MENNFKYFTEQYEAVQGSRKALLEYCKTISPADLVMESSLFGRGGSIRNLLVHIVNVYEFWVAKHALNRNMAFTNYQAKHSITEIEALFLQVDIFMNEFIELFKLPETKQIFYEINGVSNSVSPLKLFTHAVTHEFHHKGQILSLSRHLGYVPVDTDIIR